MALTDTPWTGQTANKLYLSSGQFTSTIKTSEDQTAIDGSPFGIEWDGIDSIWQGDDADKFYLTSGQFTSTIKTSAATPAAQPTGLSEDGTNTLNITVAGVKLHLNSGKFTSTIKSSLGVTAVDTEARGIVYDGTNTTWTGMADNKLYLQSGQFTSTLKTSQAITDFPIGVSWDGTNTLYCDGVVDKHYLQSGQFTSTIKTSQSVTAVDSVPRGISTNDATSRLAGSTDTTGDVAVTLPLFWQGNPNIIQFPIMSVSASPGPMALITLPIFTALATGNPDPLAVLGTASNTLPLITLAAQSGFGNHVDITLPLITVYSEKFVRGNISITLPRPTFNTVVQQGSVENIDLTLPMLTLNAFSGHPVGLILPQLTLDIVGQSGIVGTYNKSLPRMIVNVKATQKPLVTASIIFPQITLDNNVLTGEISTSGNRVFPALTLNAHAFRGENGNGAITLPALSLTTEVALNPSGTVSQSLFMLTLDAYADVYTNRII